MLRQRHVIDAWSHTANAATTVAVPIPLPGGGFGSISLTRDTDPTTVDPAGNGGSGPATKKWVDANITIAADRDEPGEDGLHADLPRQRLRRDHDTERAEPGCHLHVHGARRRLPTPTDLHLQPNDAH